MRAKNPENHDFETRKNIDFKAVFDRKIYLSGTPLGFSGSYGTF